MGFTGGFRVLRRPKKPLSWTGPHAPQRPLGAAPRLPRNPAGGAGEACRV